MNWFWLNMPLAAVFFAAWVGIPLWLVLKRPGHAPAAQAPAVQAPARSQQPAPAAPQRVHVPQRSTELAGV